MLLFLEVRQLHRLLRIHLHGLFVSSPPFINVLNCFICHQYRLIDIYSILWVIIQYYYYFLLHKSFQLWSLETFSWLLCSFDISPTIFFMLFWALPYFLALQNAEGSSCIFPAGISHFSKESKFLLLKSGIRNWDLDAEHTCCYWSVISFRLSQLTEKLTLTYVYTHIYKDFYM